MNILLSGTNERNRELEPVGRNPVESPGFAAASDPSQASPSRYQRSSPQKTDAPVRSRFIR
ncbi:MAG: hypothetical protein EA381_17220 [Planctomycetaceae bacterium]|nr:MAG: hypothetical protein EA381_17220 [Planctomycetaceae bacterium]